MIRTTTPSADELDSVFSKCLHTYRTTKHCVTGLSPFEICFGQVPRLPFDAQLSIEPSQDGITLESARLKAVEAIRKAARKAKEHYSKIQSGGTLC